MEDKAAVRFTLGKQSSMAPERDRGEADGKEKEEGEEIDGGVRLMYLANEGDLDGIRELLDSGINVNFRDIDDRTALHIAACQGQTDVVSLLLQRGANVESKDCWGSTVSKKNRLLFLPFLFKIKNKKINLFHIFLVE